MSKEVDYASTITWQIENIGSWNNDVHGKLVKSPEFVLSSLEDSEWQLSFLKNDQGDFDVLLTLLGHDRCVSFKCKWSLLDANRKTLLSIVAQHKPTEDNRVFEMFDLYTPGDLTIDRNSIFLADGKLTVRLLISKAKGSLGPSECFSIVTRFLDKSPGESFVWRIEKFRTFQLQHEALATVCLDDNVFRLRFFFVGESIDDADLNFGISTESANLKSLKVKISFFNNHKRCVEKKHQYNSTKSKQTWVVSKLASRREILEAPSDWLSGDDLTFQCTFEYDLWSYTHSYIDRSYRGPADMIGPVLENFESCDVDKETKQCPKTIVSSILNEKVQTSLYWKDPSDERGVPRTPMGDDLFYVYSERILCDFELIAGEASFHVHKVALCARSRFFRALLDGDNATKILQVPDLDKDTLGRMVTFLYSGTLSDLDWGSAARLYVAADKYEVPSLKLECSKSLRSNIALSNVCDILELADRHEDRELKTSVLEFIEDNFDGVIFSDDWDRFLERSYLAGKTMIEICRRRNAILPAFCVDKANNERVQTT